MTDKISLGTIDSEIGSSSLNSSKSMGKSFSSSNASSIWNLCLSSPQPRVMKKPSPSCSRVYWLLTVVFAILIFSIFRFSRNQYDENNESALSEITKDISTANTGVAVKILTTPNIDVPELIDIEIDALPKSHFNFLAMIDAGSSGCRVHVYRYGRLRTATGPLYILPKDKAKKVKPGLSSFVNNSFEAGPSLKGLVDFIKEEVPVELWSSTPIWLKATAGLRMLSKDDSDDILRSVRKFLSNSTNSPFYFRPSYAKLIPGNEEGAYGWISFNYMKKIIGPLKGDKKESPYAVIEMGGASSQVSQLVPSSKQAAEIPQDFKFTFRLDSESYTLYTHSYLGYGLEQAREKVNNILLQMNSSGSVLDPCINKGYVRLSSEPRPSRYDGPDGAFDVKGVSDNQGLCRSIVSRIFPENKECPFGPEKSYSFDCVYQPKFITESTNVLVFENFYYIASGINIPSATTKTDSAVTSFPLNVTPDLYRRSSDKVCGETWESLQSSYPKDSQGKDNNIKWCFGSTYAEQFLSKGLGFNANRVITIAKEVSNSDIEWALGAAYKEALEFVRSSNFRKS